MNETPGDDTYREPERLSDEQFTALHAMAAPYVALVLLEGPNRHMPGADAVIVEHGRRNIALYLQGILPIVCPVTDDTELCGLGIFNATFEEAAAVMDGDPAVQAGIFIYQLHPVRSFPGSTLPSR